MREVWTPEQLLDAVRSVVSQEVTWVLMEELGTGLVHRGRRTVRAHGIVELHYRPDW